MMIRCLAALIFVASSAAPAWTDEFEQRAGALLIEESIPGAAWAIVDAQGRIEVGTFGHVDRARTRPVDERTVFRLASVSKGFAAAAATLAVSEQRLGWDWPVAELVPAFPIAEPVITVADLLGQSTGYIPHAFDNLIEAGYDLNQIVPRFAGLEPLCSPGRCYTYQNGLFSLIEPALEAAGLPPYPQFVQQRLFVPLAMQDASLGYEAFRQADNRALPHVRRLGNWRTVDVSPNYYRVGAAAGVNASATDMGRWLNAMLGRHPEVLDTHAIAAMTEPRVRTRRDLNRRHWRELLTDAHYGLGWRIYDLGGERVVYHGGWVAGYRAEVSFSPDRGVGLAILVNAESAVVAEISTSFWKMMTEPRRMAHDGGSEPSATAP